MNRPSPREHGRSVFTTAVLLASATGAILYGVSSLQAGTPLGLARLERLAPATTLSATPTGLGTKPATIALSVQDSGAGLARVSVALVQDGKPHTLVERSYEMGGVARDEFELNVDPQAMRLHEGSASIEVSATDHSLWANAALTRREYPIDFTSPRAEPLTPQQNGTVGGAELVVFRYKGRPLAAGGVESSTGAFYSGLPLSAFDSTESFPSDTFFALFPIPYDFSPAKDSLRLAVKDDFGNTAEVPFNYRIAPKSFPDVEMGMGEDFFRRKVPELRQKLRLASPGTAVTGNDVMDFQVVNEDLRKLNEATIQKVLHDSAVTSRLWHGAFVRPLAAAPKASFAEGRRYVFGGSELSRSRHMGVDLADVAQAKVVAANKGQVVFADDLGIYGGLVIVDHGTGVSSLYGHLSAISAKKGDIVEQGQEIGRTGATGLAGGDHLHYEVRVQGVPVYPLAWLDDRWIEEHIEGKIGSFAIQQPSPQG